jgi:ribokinase
VNSHTTIWVVGSLNADLVQIVERIPDPGETLAGGDLQTYPGGKGANQACAASRLGGKVRMIGNVGSDQLGAMLLESLRSAGVVVAGVERVETPTGAASILVLKNGENAIVISPGANGNLTPDDIRGRLSGIRKGDFLLCQLESPIDAVMEALSMAKQVGATTILDPAPATHYRSDILPQVDIVTPNETEACSMLGVPHMDVRDASALKQITTRLREQGAASVLLTLGEIGCYFDGGEFAGAVSGHTVHAVDTTAAGDTFNGAFAARLAEGRSIPDALAFANAAACLAVTRHGAQTSMPSLADVEAMIARNAG